jgi:hypothetical protein
MYKGVQPRRGLEGDGRNVPPRGGLEGDGRNVPPRRGPETRRGGEDGRWGPVPQRGLGGNGWKPSLKRGLGGVGWTSPLLGRVVIAALVAVVLSGSLFFSYFLISQIERSHQSAATDTPTASAPPPHRSQAWVLGDTALLSAPGTGTVIAHVDQQFPLTLLGGTSRVNGVLWYQVGWKVPKSSGEGWAPASALTFTSPGNVPGWASFDVLSPDLEQYLTSLGDVAGAAVYDVTRQRYYTYNMNGRFITGSTIKVPIMLTFLNMIEGEGRQPNDTEMCLLQLMIENSDNDATSAFYYGYPYVACPGTFESVGGAAAVAQYLNKIGIIGLDPFPTAFGYSTTTPLATLQLLTLMQEGKVLNQQDRDLAFHLMENITLDTPENEQIGVGWSFDGPNTPPGATVAMKDGWLQGPDGLWAMNTNGIVTLGQETYIITVYTEEQNQLEDGQNITIQVCHDVAAALL